MIAIALVVALFGLVVAIVQGARARRKLQIAQGAIASLFYSEELSRVQIDAAEDLIDCNIDSARRAFDAWAVANAKPGAREADAAEAAARARAFEK